MLFRRDRERTGQLDAHGRPVIGRNDDEADPRHSGFHAAHARGCADAFEIDVEAWGVALDVNGEPVEPADMQTLVDVSDYGRPRVFRRYVKKRGPK